MSMVIPSEISFLGLCSHVASSRRPFDTADCLPHFPPPPSLLCLPCTHLLLILQICFMHCPLFPNMCKLHRSKNFGLFAPVVSQAPGRMPGTYVNVSWMTKWLKGESSGGTCSESDLASCNWQVSPGKHCPSSRRWAGGAQCFWLPLKRIGLQLHLDWVGDITLPCASAC